MIAIVVIMILLMWSGYSVGVYNNLNYKDCYREYSRGSKIFLAVISPIYIPFMLAYMLADWIWG